jgi:1,6-anhydro-N-acetylmuramate kinase
MPDPEPTDAITLTPEQEARLAPLSPRDMAALATVPRAQIVLRAHRHPQGQNATLAQRGGGRVNTVQRGRQRWQTTDGWPEAPRAGMRRPFTSRQRAQIGTLACSPPRQ